MIVLNGKYNFAKVFLPKELEKNKDGLEVYKYLDINTQVQIETFLNHPAFLGRKIRIMPDTHFGKGSCVGFTMDLGDVVIPNIIGVDIGCGIRATKLPLKWHKYRNFTALDEFIRKNIPVGFSIRNEAPMVPVDIWEDTAEVARNLGLDEERVAKSIGTLGGGNHFIELGKDEEDFLWLTIHSGSRNFGLQVANYWQNEANQICRKFYQDFGDLNFLPAGKGLGLFSGYIDDMRVAQRYAALNREVMSNLIVQDFCGVEPLEIIDSVHNFISPEDNIIRKGATSAHEGERVVIPFNMEDGLIIGTGLGNPEWNNSAPHGAGRILSRGQAKKTLSLDDARNGMKNAGIFTTSLSQETLDEAKGAYKNPELIKEMIKDTITIDNFVKPVYNLKAGEK